ncbi:hypothetical protein SmJEL517_g02884 [Synchytrium microbalum]|uniref:Transcription factor spt8 beta-propeller domain-containing protein n=1 Tax=Synchytrium microbalum TaxID=1806994 RepID=A0A507C069_9FUNG|nr:uncharacterized protein SmJEL517_g02884 [Synchytrium microbalum]TPX34467.1 hypothetical protein SmJEL517_g02884 [Synchytrium microbalum]
MLMQVDDQQINSYDITPQAVAPHPCGINCLAATSNQKWIFTGGEDGFIRKYDFFGSMNGKSPLTMAQKKELHFDTIQNAGLLSSAWDNVEQVNPASGPLQEPKISAVHSIDVHSDGVWCVTGLERGTINLWTVRHDEGNCQHVFDHHKNSVSALKITQDQRGLISASDRVIVLWDLNTGSIARQYVGPASPIGSIQLQGTHHFIVSSSDGGLFLYDQRKDAPVKRMISPDTSPWTQSASWSADGKQVYSGRRNGSVDEWDIGSGQRVRNIRMPSDSGPVSSVLALPSGRHLLRRVILTISASQDNIRLWTLDQIQESSSRAANGTSTSSSPRVPFTIVNGHHGGFVSSLLTDEHGRYLVSTSGNRGWTDYVANNSALFYGIRRT